MDFIIDYMEDKEGLGGGRSKSTNPRQLSELLGVSIEDCIKVKDKLVKEGYLKKGYYILANNEVISYSKYSDIPKEVKINGIKYKVNGNNTYITYKQN